MLWHSYIPYWGHRRIYSETYAKAASRKAEQRFRSAPRQSEGRLEASFKGADVFVIANSDIVMSCPTSELLSEIFPDVPLKKKLGPNETLLSIQKAKRGLRAAA